MKPAQYHPIPASRHALGAALGAQGCPMQPQQAMSFLRHTAGRFLSVIEFVARDAWPQALPSDGLGSEDGMLRSAHWNRIYLVRGGKT